MVGFLLCWKKNIVISRIKTIDNFSEVIVLLGFISIETSIELNYRFLDLAGLE